MTRPFRSFVPAIAISIAAGCAIAVLTGSLAARYLSGEAAAPDRCLAVNDRPESPGAGMILIPAGRFKMGSEDFRPEEAPVREAAVESFWIDSHDVTNAQSPDSSPRQATSRFPSAHHRSHLIRQ
jgi:formylglycine-generating enzyme required for sulfatase activity